MGQSNETFGKLSLRTGTDVVLCRHAVRRIAYNLSYPSLGQTMLVTAASELARNTVIYGGGGEFFWEVVRQANRVGVRLTFEDHGPGIPDLALAMTPGWTSGDGLGLGLCGAKRLVHEFSIISTVGTGTRVVITRWK